MTDFKSKFEAYGGDYQAVLEKFMGDEEFYLQMLQMLSGDTYVERMGAALEKGDLEAAFDAAHELKGVAGNLSLPPLYNAVCAIVEPLRHHEPLDYAPLYEEVKKAFCGAVALLPE